MVTCMFLQNPKTYMSRQRQSCRHDDWVWQLLDQQSCQNQQDKIEAWMEASPVPELWNSRETTKMVEEERSLGNNIIMLCKGICSTSINDIVVEKAIQGTYKCMLLKKWIRLITPKLINFSITGGGPMGCKGHWFRIGKWQGMMPRGHALFDDEAMRLDRAWNIREKMGHFYTIIGATISWGLNISCRPGGGKNWSNL